MSDAYRKNLNRLKRALRTAYWKLEIDRPTRASKILALYYETLGDLQELN